MHYPKEIIPGTNPGILYLSHKLTSLSRWHPLNRSQKDTPDLKLLSPIFINFCNLDYFDLLKPNFEWSGLLTGAKWHVILLTQRIRSNAPLGMKNPDFIEVQKSTSEKVHFRFTFVTWMSTLKKIFWASTGKCRGPK